MKKAWLVCLSSWLSVVITISFLVPEVSSGFPLVFPFLTTGWYYKPGPTESIVLGLLLVKVLALRLGSATGVIPIPYHLNDLFSQRIGKRSLRSYSDHVKSNHTFNVGSHTQQPLVERSLSKEEEAVISRILLGIRRIDSHDCFIRMLCQMNQDVLSGKGSAEDETLLQVFRIQPKTKGPATWSVWDVYEKAMKRQPTDCNQLYPTCPLKESDLEFESLMTGLF